MRVNYSKALGWVRWAAVGLVTFTVVTVAGGFILQLCVGTPWYEHAWDTVAKVTAFVLWVVGSTWFHWIGGMTIGFAVGIWLDDLLRRLAAAQINPKAAPPKREKGFLDYQLDIVTSVKESCLLLGRVIEKTVWLGKQFPKMTRRLERLTKRASQNPSVSHIREGRRIAADMAKKYDEYSSFVARIGEEYRRHVSNVITATQWLNDNHPEFVQTQDKASMTNARESCILARQQVLGFVGSIKAQRGVTAEMTAAIDRTVPNIEQLAESIGLLEQYCVGYLAVHE